MALEVLLNDEVELDDNGAHDVFNIDAEPELWWTRTELGRRVIEALVRLQAVFEEERLLGDFKEAWDTLETMTDFFGAGVWLRDGQARVERPDTEWIRSLLERCGSGPMLLVPVFLHDASEALQQQCQRVADAYMVLSKGPGLALELFRLAYHGIVIPRAQLVGSITELGQVAHSELSDAVPARHELRIANAVMLGAAALLNYERWCDATGEQSCD